MTDTSNRNTWLIKGSCEHCGFAYKGRIGSDTTSYPLIKCPHCGEITYNFDDEKTVDANDKEEGYSYTYVESEFETAKDESSNG